MALFALLLNYQNDVRVRLSANAVCLPIKVLKGNMRTDSQRKMIKMSKEIIDCERFARRNDHKREKSMCSRWELDTKASVNTCMSFCSAREPLNHQSTSLHTNIITSPLFSSANRLLYIIIIIAHTLAQYKKAIIFQAKRMNELCGLCNMLLYAVCCGVKLVVDKC